MALSSSPRAGHALGLPGVTRHLPPQAGHESQGVQDRDHNQQEPVAGDQRHVLDRAADHGAEQVCGERRPATFHTGESLREYEVGEEHGGERQRAAGQEPGNDG